MTGAAPQENGPPPLGDTILVEIAHDEIGPWIQVRLDVRPDLLFTIIPASTLETIGLANLGLVTVTDAGRELTRRRGLARMRRDYRLGSAQVLFGEPDDPTCIGALALGALGLGPSASPTLRGVDIIPSL